MNIDLFRLLAKVGIAAAAAAVVGKIIKSSDPAPSKTNAAPNNPANTNKPQKPDNYNNYVKNIPEPEKSSPPKPAPGKRNPNCCSLPDRFYPKLEEIYIPDKREAEKANVPIIELTEEEATRLGFSFRKKSKSVRVTNYHGTKREIIIPSKIGGKPVNELGSSAFEKADLDRIEIPDSVKKAGDHLFYNSKIREVRFGSGLTVIPKYAFAECKELRSVILPNTVITIEDEAFRMCRSLEYLAFPDSLCFIRGRAFSGSGLMSFSMRFPARLNDPLAFQNTALHKAYKLIATENTDERLRVLLVGANIEIKLPNKRVIFCDNSICGGFTIDLSECREAEMKHAVCEDPGIRFFPNTVILRHEQENYYFPPYVNAVYTDGEKYKGISETLEDKDGSMTVKISGQTRVAFLPRRFMKTRARELTVKADYILKIESEAFSEPNLERLDLTEVGGYIKAEGEIFSWNCFALREVRWNSIRNGVSYTQYIPPSELIGRYLHEELLKAFRPTKTKPFTKDYLFDRTVPDKLFSEKALVIHTPFEKSMTRLRLTQRQLILTAIDVLRSSPALYEGGTSDYSDYLRRHIKYARTLCERISPRYPKYKQFLASFK